MQFLGEKDDAGCDDEEKGTGSRGFSSRLGDEGIFLKKSSI